MNVVFRTDASHDIGTGHVMRCLSLADELRHCGAKCVFICIAWNGNMIAAIRARGHIVIELPSTESKKIENEVADAADTLSALHSIAIDWMLVDHYQLSKYWEIEVKSNCKRLMVIDDLANRQHVCDLLLDQNHGRHPDTYRNLVPSDCLVLTGASFALLRPQFAAAREKSLIRRADGKLKKILITMGGIDKDNATCSVLDALACSELDADCEITVVMGGDSIWKNQIERKAAEMRWKTLMLTNVDDMAKLMCASDLAITAAGTTLWELCCLGVPIIATITADNQRQSAEALLTSDALMLVRDPELLTHELPIMIRQCQTNAVLQKLSAASQSITNGRGIRRIAEKINDASTGFCSIRAMLPADTQMVLAWRNHLETRQHMTTQHTISLDEHEAWYESTSQNPNQQLLIVEEDSKPFGFVRLNNVGPGKTAEWGFYVAPGMPAGNGKKLGTAALNYAFGSLGLKKLTGSVFVQNARSIHFHKSLGFVQESMPRQEPEGMVMFGLLAESWRSRKTT